jgi:hypothetical protein
MDVVDSSAQRGAPFPCSHIGRELMLICWGRKDGYVVLLGFEFANCCEFKFQCEQLITTLFCHRLHGVLYEPLKFYFR